MGRRPFPTHAARTNPGIDAKPRNTIWASPHRNKTTAVAAATCAKKTAQSTQGSYRCGELGMIVSPKAALAIQRHVRKT